MYNTIVWVLFAYISIGLLLILNLSSRPGFKQSFYIMTESYDLSEDELSRLYKYICLVGVFFWPALLFSDDYN